MKTVWFYCKEIGEGIINSMRSSSKLERLGSRDQAEEFALDRRGPSCPGGQWERGNYRWSSAIYLMAKAQEGTTGLVSMQVVTCKLYMISLFSLLHKEKCSRTQARTNILLITVISTVLKKIPPRDKWFSNWCYLTIIINYHFALYLNSGLRLCTFKYYKQE